MSMSVTAEYLGFLFLSAKCKLKMKIEKIYCRSSKKKKNSVKGQLWHEILKRKNSIYKDHLK